MASVAVIGGTGLEAFEGLELIEELDSATPYGCTSAPPVHGRVDGIDIMFLSRHGPGHLIAPHKVNYRANLWALKNAGVDAVFAVAAVGGIHTQMGPGAIVVPDQIIDYTVSRVASFSEASPDGVVHVDFTLPYSDSVRYGILDAAQSVAVTAVDFGVYAATEGPRLETAAEINRIERDGGDIVGMTGMPEAVLARELELDYGCCALVVNWAAGRSSEPLTLALMRRYLDTGMQSIRKIITAFAVAR
jgi:5'-methylthioinosine phosphorylase